MALSTTIKQTQLLINCIAARPNYIINVETANYLLKTATNIKELFLAFKLRQQAFAARKSFFKNLIEFDIDEFDFSCDHLVIIDKKKKKVCGTYRLRPSTYSPNFYSQTEFDLNNFLKIPGEKLELGRACIAPEHRNGAVIDILWKGIGQYAIACNARYLFGCSSVKTTNRQKARSLYQLLDEKQSLSCEYLISPLATFDGHIFDNTAVKEDVGHLLPPLLRSYLNAGAKVHGAPAFDFAFNCIDFFTILDLAQISSAYKKRYFS